MNSGIFNQVFSFIGRLFDWWFIVMPWEQAVFVRAGKNAKVKTKGLYFKVPFLDRVYIQQTRKRMIDMPVQTVSTKDGRAITVKAVAGYCIKDVYKLYNSISHPEITLSGMVMSGIAEYIRKSESSQLTPMLIEESVISNILDSDYGIGELSVKITSWADVKTFRLIQDSSWMSETLKMDHIDEK